MITLIVEVALMLLALFFIVPTVMIFVMVLREFVLQHRRQIVWRKDDEGKLAG